MSTGHTKMLYIHSLFSLLGSRSLAGSDANSGQPRHVYSICTTGNNAKGL